MNDIGIANGLFVDSTGRTLVLRGLNVSGSSKVPVSAPGGFYDHGNVSFVGRPFPLSDAQDHFNRIRSWGFTLLRLLVTWEAVEHGGPGVFDEAYLKYLSSLVSIAHDCRLHIIVDFHQDVWSRFSGGSGAPGWTFEAAGLDMSKFDRTGAAITAQAHVLPYPSMVWPTNGVKLAAATMFTLFFGGDDFAPSLRYSGSSIQEFLQSHFVGMVKRVASTLRDAAAVIGYDVFNEPLAGFIGCSDLSRQPEEPRIGAMPTPLQSMALGEGLSVEVENWEFGPTGSRNTGRVVLNESCERVWLADYRCPFRERGVWDMGPVGTARLRLPDYFSRVGSRAVDFNENYYQPFLQRVIHALKEADPAALHLVEPVVGPAVRLPSCTADTKAAIVSAPHWYDGTALMLKRFHVWLGADALRRVPVFGRRKIRRSYAAQLKSLSQAASEPSDRTPTLFGEVGVPFDMHGRRHRAAAEKSMERSLRAMDDAIASYTLWNYTPDNTHEQGDRWNGEDFSVFCAEEHGINSDEDSGGRALRSVIRPYAMRTAGNVIRMSFDPKARIFELLFDGDDTIATPTVIFVPRYHYGSSYSTDMSDGRCERDADAQLVRYYHEKGKSRHRLTIMP